MWRAYSVSVAIKELEREEKRSERQSKIDAIALNYVHLSPLLFLLLRLRVVTYIFFKIGGRTVSTYFIFVI